MNLIGYQNHKSMSIMILIKFVETTRACRSWFEQMFHADHKSMSIMNWMKLRSVLSHWCKLKACDFEKGSENLPGFLG